MNQRNKFWWFVAVSVAISAVVISTTGFFIWYRILPHEKLALIHIFKENFPYIFAIAFLILAGIGFALDGIFHIYILPLSRLSEETVLINSVNPSHRVKTDGSKDIVRLAQTINDWAERCEILQNDVQTQVDLAKAEAEREKNILAAIMAEG